MTVRRAPRGQPLVALAIMLSLWTGARAWIVNSTSVDTAASAALSGAPSPSLAAAGEPQLPSPVVPIAGPTLMTVEPAPAVFAMRQSDSPMPIAAPVLTTMAFAAKPARTAHMSPALAALAPVRLVTGHQLLWMAALARLPAPSEVIALADRNRPPLLPAPALGGQATRAPTSAGTITRWSGDSWVLYRRGGAGLSAGGQAPPSYGDSQAGAVLHYALDPGSAHRPALYLRGTRGFAAPHGEELAAGLSLRPVPHMPVRALAELRATRIAGAVRLRPAAMVVSEVPPLALPGGLRGEAYVQGGYVGGPGATSFVDGQARVDRRLMRVGRTDLRLGGGVWGGAQRGAARIDAGPSASLGLPLGGTASARLAMDWRFRLAGSAQPRSGPALTLSAGF